MRKFVVAGAMLAFAVGVSGCSSTPKVAVQQPADLTMSCEALKGEFAKLDKVMEEAEHNKGVNGANVAAVLLFWPAAVGNYMSADKAEELVEKRRTHLMEIYKSKNCS